MSQLLFDKSYFFEFIGKNDAFATRVTGLRMAFDIEKNLTEIPNPATFKLWNLSAAKRAQIEDPEIYCSLNAGYGPNPPLIFKGAVIDAYSHPEGPDIVTYLEVRDGFIEWRDEISTVNFSPKESKTKKGVVRNLNATAKNIINYCAKDLKMAVKYDSSVQDFLFKRGFSYYGAAREAISRVCKAAGYIFSIQNGVIYIHSRQWSITDSGILITSDSGMIGSPERLRTTAKQTAKVKDEETGKKVDVKTATPKFDGWRITSLLRPELECGDYFIVKSKMTPFENGKTIRATKVRHSGDTHTDDWYTQAEADDRRD